MTNDDGPGYLGADLMAGASQAIDQAPELADQIRARVQRLAHRVDEGEKVDGLDADVQGLIELISRAGVQPPPMRSHKP